MLPHLVLLAGEDAERRTRLARAQQDKAGFAILREVAGGVGLIHLTAVDQPASAGEAASLMAQRWKMDAGSLGGIPYVLVVTDLDRAFAAGKDECDQKEGL